MDTGGQLDTLAWGATKNSKVAGSCHPFRMSCVRLPRDTNNRETCWPSAWGIDDRQNPGAENESVQGRVEGGKGTSSLSVGFAQPGAGSSVGAHSDYERR